MGSIIDNTRGTDKDIKEIIKKSLKHSICFNLNGDHEYTLSKQRTDEELWGRTRDTRCEIECEVSRSKVKLTRSEE